ncbi:S-methyl-5-thioribose-1-phosphate isomerase [Dethiosulfovibrio salsuginis]|uniref:Methylthioribose-1-phosphate isomerase n=1 Tax=Dethiosulfovibrio salsuginis TaxID=561720 RepID=A0A1X7I3M3_9BACT|nr:S-methyl-5-thioribose-1-phosphate isomerase [Dethiosulfovibrio salsuginis]SMG08313.1 methylthioribose-1-phosphate isomerase [Dethiosulfovibrio salsuginis]
MVPETFKWLDGELVLLDQRAIPWETCFVTCKTYEDVAKAISSMVVRGAPAIGVAAAYGMALASLAGEDMKRARETLLSSRPTAVNLRWALERMDSVIDRSPDDIIAMAQRLHREDLEINRAIGDNGEALVSDGSVILTHCNAGAIATAGWGTALGVIRSCRERGKSVKVYADETRPRLQGGLLTSWELMEDGFDVTVISDGMAAWLMKKVSVDCVIVGADRIAANGDTANKIGTYGLSLAAKAHGVPFYVAAPLSTFDLSLSSGDGIPIEERDGDEVRAPYGKRLLPEDVEVWNPAFDVTPGENVTAIITEVGVLRPPYGVSIAKAIKEI